MSKSTDKNFKAVGKSLIFYLDSGSLYLKDKDSNQVNLTSTIAEDIVCFDVSYDKSSSNIRIAIISMKDNKYSVYVTDTFKSKEFVWTSFSSDSKKWGKNSLNDTTLVIDRIIVNPNGVAVATAPANKNAGYCYYDNKNWQEYTLPENVTKIFTMTFGTVYTTDGLYLYYSVEQSNTLLFQSFIDPQYGKTTTYRFDVSKNKIKELKSLMGHDGNSSLFAFWDKGVYLFTDPKNARKTILEPEADFLISDFCATLTAKTKSFFALENQDKQYSKDKKTHYNLTYLSGVYPEFMVNAVLK